MPNLDNDVKAKKKIEMRFKDLNIITKQEMETDFKTSFFKNLDVNKDVDMRAKISNKDLSKKYKQVKRLGGTLSELNLKAYNSKDADKAYDNFLKTQQAIGSSGKTRHQLFVQAKRLGYKQQFNRSKIIDLNNFIRSVQDKSLKKIQSRITDSDSKFSGDDWKSKFEKHTRSLKRFSRKQINDLLSKIASQGKLILQVKFVGEPDFSYRNLSKIDPELLSNMLEQYTEVKDTTGTSSDAITEIKAKPVESMEIITLTKSDKKTVSGGGSKKRAVGWFPYYNAALEIDLSQYQIFTDSNTDEDVSCLIWSLKLAGVDEVHLKKITSAVGSGIHISNKKLHQVADILKCRITLLTENESDDNKNNIKRISKYGKSDINESITLGRIDNHLFLVRETKYTKFYVKNRIELLDDVSDEKFKYTKKDKGKCRSYNPKFLNSFELILNLKKQGCFTEYRKHAIAPSNLYKSEAHLFNVEEDQKQHQSKPTIQEQIDKNIQKYQSGECSEVTIPVTSYFAGDIESDVVSCDYHKAIAISFQDIENNEGEIFTTSNGDSQELFNSFTNNLTRESTKVHNKKIEEYHKLYPNYNLKFTKNTIIYFHNSKYDTTLFPSSLTVQSECSKQGALYEKVYIMKGMLVSVRDSHKYFGCALTKLPKMLGLSKGTSKGEAIGYTFHTQSNICNDDWVSPDVYKHHLKKAEYKTFDEIQSEMNPRHFKEVNGQVLFNPSVYYIDYLEMDVKVLAQALSKFRELIHEITELDAFESLTISSIGHKMACKSGCYEGVYQSKGGLRDYIQKAVRGGRVMVNQKYKKKVIGEIVNDFDGVSLYPSAMARLCKKYGVAKGEMKVGGSNYEFYKNKDYYIVTIKLIKLNKHVQVPHLSKSVNESLLYSNEWENETFTIDRYALEDLIQYQEASFEIIDGIYWNDGFNKEIGNLAQHLHAERCKHKGKNEGLSSVIKLLMNSIYGKTMLKRSEEKISYVPNKDFDRHLYDNFGTIKEYSGVDNPRVKVVSSEYDNSFSLNHVAVSILSTSKRIMNEVFNCMDKSKLPMYYTDTDSIHMNNVDVPILASTYKELYNKELIGKDLGQFHCDFTLGSCNDVTSIHNISLGPKSYLDVLKGVNASGDVEHGLHIRLKGITSAGVEAKLVEYGSVDIGRIEAAKSLFNSLAEGNSEKFTLNPTDSVSFDFTRDGVYTRKVGSFKRMVKF